MKKKIIAVDLDFPKEIEFYGPRPNDKHLTYPKRHKLRGKLRIVTSQPTSIYSIEIRFKGATHLYWRDPLSHSLLATRMVNGKTIRKSKHILLQEGTLPSGVTDLGFEITIPGYIYPTYQSEYVSIKYGISARIISTGKFTKDVEVYRDIIIRKTFMPKDVASGLVNGYQVPRCTMRGQRNQWLAWEFKVPKWACLGNDVEFTGYLKSLNDQLIVDMIQVDVVQEELYIDGASDQSRRHLIICPNIPSTYLHPPLGTNIQFQFPLYTLKKELIKSTIQDKNNTYIKCDDLNYSVQSPFLVTRHYIRVIIYTRNKNEYPSSFTSSTSSSSSSSSSSTTTSALLLSSSKSSSKSSASVHKKPTPICIGLPIQLTEYIQLSSESSDILPSYQSLIRDCERLPDYVTTMEDFHHEIDQNENETNHDQNDNEIIHIAQEEQSINTNIMDANSNNNRNDDDGSNYHNPTFQFLESIIGASHPMGGSIPLNDRQFNHHPNKHEGNIVVQERRLDDFWLELS